LIKNLSNVYKIYLEKHITDNGNTAKKKPAVVFPHMLWKTDLIKDNVLPFDGNRS
jgi:hypothetical protein